MNEYDKLLRSSGRRGSVDLHIIDGAQGFNYGIDRHTGNVVLLSNQQLRDAQRNNPAERQEG